MCWWLVLCFRHFYWLVFWSWVCLGMFVCWWAELEWFVQTRFRFKFCWLLICLWHEFLTLAMCGLCFFWCSVRILVVCVLSWFVSHFLAFMIIWFWIHFVGWCNSYSVILVGIYLCCVFVFVSLLWLGVFMGSKASANYVLRFFLFVRVFLLRNERSFVVVFYEYFVILS